MSLALPALLGVHDAGARRLIRPGALDPLVTLTRAGAGSRATALGAGGTAWSEFPADTPRFHNTARRLLIGAGRTNAVPNPRGEGGNASTVPTGWLASGNLNGLTRTLIGRQTIDGVECYVAEWSGTPTANQNYDITPMGVTSITTAAGEDWAWSPFVAILSGTMAGVTAQHVIVERDGVGGALTTQAPVTFSPDGALRRFPAAFTIGNAGAQRVTAAVRMRVTNGIATSFRVALGWPQLERGAFATTPILPVTGSPAASTRGADLVSATLAALGLGANGACTILFGGMIPQAAPAGADQSLLQLDDGTDGNRLRVRNTAGGSSIIAGRVTAGTASDAAALGTLTPGTPFRLAVSLNGAGRIAASLDGGADGAVTGGPVGSLTTLRIGNSAAATTPLAGEAGTLSVIPYSTADAALPSLCATIP